MAAWILYDVFNMEASTLTVILVIPAAALISAPLAYQCRFSALAYLPFRLALKV